MTGDARYRRHNVVDVDAAVVGISRRRWTSLPPSLDEADEARRVMAEHRFDVLPVDGPEVSAFYVTKDWGDYGVVDRREVGANDRLPYDTPLREVIRLFAGGDGRHFFFLSGEGNEVTGLITVANLNCSQARVYVFGLLVELEVTLANYVQHEERAGRVSEAALFACAPDAAVGRYVKESREGMDRHLVEYLYLSNLINVVERTGLHESLGHGKKPFKEAFGRLNDFRNRVAHPVRSLVEHPDEAGRLWAAIQAAEDALGRLSAFRPWAPVGLHDGGPAPR